MQEVVGDLLRYSFIFMCLFFYTNFFFSKLLGVLVEAINRYVGLGVYMKNLTKEELETNGQTGRTQEN